MFYLMVIWHWIKKRKKENERQLCIMCLNTKPVILTQQQLQHCPTSSVIIGTHYTVVPRTEKYCSNII